MRDEKIEAHKKNQIRLVYEKTTPIIRRVVRVADESTLSGKAKAIVRSVPFRITARHIVVIDTPISKQSGQRRLKWETNLHIVGRGERDNQRSHENFGSLALSAFVCFLFIVILCVVVAFPLVVGHCIVHSALVHERLIAGDV